MTIKIKGVSTQIIDILIKRSNQFSTEKVSDKSFVLLKIELTNGMIGIGEGTTPGVWWNGESVETMQAIIDRYVTPILLGENILYIEKIMQVINRNIRANPFAKATVEMALYDSLGKVHH